MDNGCEWMNLPQSTGTTIMALEYDGGVIIGADSRTSGGDYVVNRYADKLTRVTDKIYCCRSGSAAHTQAIADTVSYILYYKEIQTGEEPLVSTAAREFRNCVYNYRDTLLAGIIVAGWDKELGGQVYTVGLCGLMKRQPMVLGGSGSTYIMGFVNEHYRPNLSKDECVELVKKSIRHAIICDGSSGGVIRIGDINKDGIEYKIFECTDKQN